MIEKIRQHIDTIQKALDWIKDNEPQDYERQFLSFVEERRKLYKIAEAEEFNPAAAAYGESQKGKSYLMSNLLQKDGQPFLIRYDGRDYNFIAEMNPKGDGSEATGVVTRFTSFKRGHHLYSERYPLLMRTLSVTDIILILADGYYNDISDYSVPDDLKEKAEALYKKYINAPVQHTTPIKPDDLLEMEFYFSKYINNAQAYGKAGYFKRLALVADRIPVADFVDVFGLLWDNNKYLSNLFQQLLVLQARLGYARYVYLPVDAVLYNDNDSNTIMSVQCLHGNNEASTALTEVYIREGDSYRTVEGIRKCDLAAICGEIIVRIPDDFLSSSGSYCMDGMAEDTRRMVSSGPIKKDILEKVDLLDFPGARSRLRLYKNRLMEEKESLTNILLRGKVAYLFNKYNESRVINVMLFCHDKDQSNVSDLRNLVTLWVKNYVGNTPEQRALTVERCGGISPLFYIATKFNLDMEMNAIPTKNSSEAIKGRWEQRFRKVVYPECFGSESWVSNWANGDKFSNSYLLRDFKYSGDNGSRLYRGFYTEGSETGMIISEEHYRNLRDTFVNSEATRLFFNKPELAWDVAATKNNDGALYIIEKLSIVATRMLATRDSQFNETIDKARDLVLNAMTHYKPAGGDQEQMIRNINNAYAVIRELDFACNEDNYYFGHLVEGLQLKVKDIHDLVHEMILHGELTGPRNDFKEYQLIRKRCKDFEGCSTVEDKWACLVKCMYYPSKQAAKADLERRKIDVNLLFADKLMPQLPSYMIAERILKYWIDKIKSVDFINTYTSDDGFSPIVMTELVNNLSDTVARYDLLERLHDDLKPYTDVAAVMNIPVPLVSDIIASSISNFVTDFGYSYLDEDKKEQLRRMAQAEGWPVFNYISIPRKELYEPEEIAALFDEVLTSGSPLTPAFERNYFSWGEYVFLSFMLRVERPKYTVDVCQRLSEIIEKTMQ